MATTRAGDSGQRQVLVTGASSGIGRATALLLAGRGIRVFAACRKAADAEALTAAAPAGLIQPVTMDVNDIDSVHAARTTVETMLCGRGLDGLVNNAGTGISAPVEAVSLSQMRANFEVNVFGQIAVIQTFLPLLRPKRGRIVNLGSVGARIAIPFGGVLCATKAAFTSFNDALRLELSSEGIKVCLIEPGSIRTPAVDKTLGGVEPAIAGWPEPMRGRYGAPFRRFTERAMARESGGSPPEVVAQAIHHALTSDRPHLRYPVGRDARLLSTLPQILSTAALDGLRLRLFGMRVAKSVREG